MGYSFNLEGSERPGGCFGDLCDVVSIEFGSFVDLEAVERLLKAMCDSATGIESNILDDLAKIVGRELTLWEKFKVLFKMRMEER